MHYQFGWCNGACKNEELPVKYNLRFLTAFFKTKIAKWPFDGTISLEGQIVNNWCLEDKDFDYDIYKILRRYLKKNPKNYNYLINPVVPKHYHG